jgi:ubiquinol-cytochrome c reductase cytochrome c subunit
MMNFLAVRRRHPLAGFLVMALTLVFLGLAFGAASPSKDATAASPTDQSTAIEEGERLFAVSCASCHGLSAQGTSVAPSLIGVGAAAVDFQVSTGRMPMAYQEAQAQPKPPVFNPEQIGALAAFVASLGPGPAIPGEEDYGGWEDADLLRGNQLFAANCASCHNFAGSGGELTDGKHAPPLAGSDARTIWEAMITGPQSMPVFGDGAMPPEDKRAIIRYVKTLEETPNAGGAGIGRLGPVTEGLFGWLLGMGALLTAAIWIGVKSR